MDELIDDTQFIGRISRYINSGDTQPAVMVQSLEILRLSGVFWPPLRPSWIISEWMVSRKDLMLNWFIENYHWTSKIIQANDLRITRTIVNTIQYPLFLKEVFLGHSCRYHIIWENMFLDFKRCFSF